MPSVSRALLLIVCLLAACSEPEFEPPRSARDMVVTLQSFDVVDSGSLETANVYMTRFTPRLDSTAQDSAWMGYLDFLTRFIDYQNSQISEGGPDVENPYTVEGLVLIEDSLGWRFEVDHVWQRERFTPLVHPNLGTFISISSHDGPANLAETFAQLHRLEYWADHHPLSPLSERVSNSYRRHLKFVLTKSAGSWSDSTIRQKIFDGMQAFAGLDANQILGQFILDHLIDAQPNPDLDEIVAQITDTLRYHPRPIDLYLASE